MTKAPHDTLGALTESHLQLLEAWTGSKSQVRAAHALRRRIQKVGRQLADPAQRDAAQGLLDYWASRIAGCEGETYPEVVRLAAFDGGAVDRLADRAEAVLRGLPPADQLAAVRLFEAFHEGGERARAARLSDRDLEALFPAGDWRGVADPFIEAGILIRSRPVGSEVDTLELASPALADQWGSLKEWLAYREQRIGYRRVRLGAARLWDARGRKADGLLRGSVLTGALKTHNEDRALEALGAARAGDEAVERHHRDEALLEAYLKASRQHEWTVLGSLASASFVVLGAVAVLGVLLVLALGDDEETREKASTAQKAAVRAERDLAQQALAQDLDAGAPSLEQAQDVAPVAAARQLVPVSPRGCIWIGGARSSRLGDARERRLAPDTATAGRAYRILGPTFLRGRCPDADYTFGDSLGVVTRGRVIVAEAEPLRFERATDPGFWLPVSVTPRVYVQHHGGDAAARQALPAAVERAGFEVPPVEEIAAARNLVQVRYFKAEDRAAAERLAQTLRAAYAGRRGEPLTVSCIRPRVETEQIGVLEVWMDLDRVARRDGPPPPEQRLCA